VKRDSRDNEFRDSVIVVLPALVVLVVAILQKYLGQ
jgi:hypothetical protein